MSSKIKRSQSYLKKSRSSSREEGELIEEEVQPNLILKPKSKETNVEATLQS